MPDASSAPSSRVLHCCCCVRALPNGAVRMARRRRVRAARIYAGTGTTVLARGLVPALKTFSSRAIADRRASRARDRGIIAGRTLARGSATAATCPTA